MSEVDQYWLTVSDLRALVKQKDARIEELEREVEAYKTAIHVCVASVSLRKAIYDGARAVLEGKK